MLGRVSTNSMYRTGEQNIMRRQNELLSAQTQLSSGKRINSPADDPLAAADATGIRAGLSQFEQFKDNQDHARYLLNLGESALRGVIDAVQQVQTRLVEAGNGSYSDAERRVLAQDLEGVLARIVGLANSSDGATGYLFAGARENVVPFVQSGNLVSFSGDEILQRLEVSKDRFQQVKYSGDALFNKIRAGNGSFTTAADGANAGTAWIDAGSVTDPAALTGRPYRIALAVSGGATSYSVIRSNADASSTVVASGSYSSPQEIRFDGIRVSLTGQPADGDGFDVAPSSFQSLFDTMAQAIADLRMTVQGSNANAAKFQTALSAAQASMGQAFEHLLLKQADIGTALQELDAFELLNDDRQLEYRTRLSNVEDLDIAQAASTLAQRQATFQAALQSYSQVSRLSLFDYL